MTLRQCGAFVGLLVAGVGAAFCVGGLLGVVIGWATYSAPGPVLVLPAPVQCAAVSFEAAVDQALQGRFVPVACRLL